MRQFRSLSLLAAAPPPRGLGVLVLLLAVVSFAAGCLSRLVAGLLLHCSLCCCCGFCVVCCSRCCRLVAASKPGRARWLWPLPRAAAAAVRLLLRGHRRFTEEGLLSFLAGNQLKIMIRGHECVPAGTQRCCSGCCLTVFSAPNYCQRFRNDAAAIQLYRHPTTGHLIIHTLVRQQVSLEPLHPATQELLIFFLCSMLLLRFVLRLRLLLLLLRHLLAL